MTSGGVEHGARSEAEYRREQEDNKDESVYPSSIVIRRDILPMECRQDPKEKHSASQMTQDVH